MKVDVKMQRPCNILVAALMGVVGFSSFAACHEPAVTSADENRVAGHRVLKGFNRLHDAKLSEKIWVGGALTVLQTSDEKFWISTEVGIYVYDEKLDQWTTLFAAKQLGGALFPELHQTKDDKIWLRSQINGSVKYFDGKELKEDPRLSGHSVKAIFSGSQDKTWFVLEDEILAYEGGVWSKSLTVPSAIRATCDQMPMMGDARPRIRIQNTIHPRSTRLLAREPSVASDPTMLPIALELPCRILGY